jgi:predicted nuclease of predicted toxin-antitoxin system
VKFLLDQDVPDRIADVLQASGHEAVRLRKVLARDASDSEVLRHAYASHAVLITCNRDDFLKLAATQPHCGIVILVRRRTRIAECAALLRLIGHGGASGIDRNINFA